MNGNLFSRLTAWVVGVIEFLGYVGSAGLIVLDDLYSAMPLGRILPLSGFRAGRDRLLLPGVVVAAIVGSLTGTLALCASGAELGEARLRRLIARCVWGFGSGKEAR